MSPSETQTLAGRVKENGHLFVDEPVTGGVDAARDGTMTIMASGNDNALTACDDAFRAMSGKIARCGNAPGAATTIKMINQLMVGAQIALAAEAMTLAAKAGANPHIVYDEVGSGAARSFVWESRVPSMLNGDFSARGVLDIFIKDLKIVLDSAREVGAYTPLAATALQIYQIASASGRGQEQDSAVVSVYEGLANQRVTTRPIEMVSDRA